MDARNIEGQPVDAKLSSPFGRRVFFGLASIATTIVVISGLLYVAVVLTGGAESAWHPAYELFDVAREFNIATWFASALWIFLALCAISVGIHAPKYRLSWYVLATIATLASIDEYVLLHEKLWVIGARLAELLPFDPFSYRWVIVGMVIAIAVVAALTPLAVRLPRRNLLGILIAGGVFLLGAVGLETWGGFVEQHFGGQVTWHLMLLIHIEEWLEKMGVTLAVWRVGGMLRVTRAENGITTKFLGYRPQQHRT